MTSKTDRHTIYKTCFEALPLNQAGLARLMNLGEPATASVRSKVSDKLKGLEGRAITKAEALAIQTLLMLHHRGVDLERLEFDASGFIKELTQK